MWNHVYAPNDSWLQKWTYIRRRDKNKYKLEMFVYWQVDKTQLEQKSYDYWSRLKYEKLRKAVYTNEQTNKIAMQQSVLHERKQGVEEYLRVDV